MLTAYDPVFRNTQFENTTESQWDTVTAMLLVASNVIPSKDTFSQSVTDRMVFRTDKTVLSAVIGPGGQK